MNMENLMSGAFGALFVTVFDFVLLRKQNKLEDRLNLVEDEKITQLERKINKHLEADRSQEILAELRNLGGAVMRLSDSTARSLENIASQNSRLAAHDLYLQELNESTKEHIRIYHHGKQ